MPLQNTLLNSISGKKKRSNYFNALPGEQPYQAPTPAAQSPISSNLTQGVKQDQKAMQELQPAQNFTNLPSFKTDYGSDLSKNIVDGYARDQLAANPMGMNYQGPAGLGTPFTYTANRNPADVNQELQDLSTLKGDISPEEISNINSTESKTFNIPSMPKLDFVNIPRGQTQARQGLFSYDPNNTNPGNYIYGGSGELTPNEVFQRKDLSTLAQTLGDTLQFGGKQGSDVSIKSVNGQANELYDPSTGGASPIQNSETQLSQYFQPGNEYALDKAIASALNPSLGNVQGSKTIAKPGTGQDALYEDYFKDGVRYTRRKGAV